VIHQLLSHRNNLRPTTAFMNMTQNMDLKVLFLSASRSEALVASAYNHHRVLTCGYDLLPAVFGTGLSRALLCRYLAPLCCSSWS